MRLSGEKIKFLGAIIVFLGCSYSSMAALASNQNQHKDKTTISPTLVAQQTEKCDYTYAELAQGIIEETNEMRSDPAAYAAKLEARKASIDDDNIYVQCDGKRIKTKEGKAAVDEAIEALKNASKLKALQADTNIEKVAQYHVDDIGPKGQVTHNSSDGKSFSQRLDSFGEWSGKIAENISFGSKTPQDVLLALIIDDGVANRGHRTNLLKDFTVEDGKPGLIGVACGEHTKYGIVCVMDYVGEFTPKQ